MCSLPVGEGAKRTRTGLVVSVMKILKTRSCTGPIGRRPVYHGLACAPAAPATFHPPHKSTPEAERDESPAAAGNSAPRRAAAGSNRAPPAGGHRNSHPLFPQHHEPLTCVHFAFELSKTPGQDQSDIEAIAIGFELCGTYVRISDEHIVYGVPPISSVGKIRSYLRRCRHERHASRALRNLDFVCERSNSIRESALAMYLSLPMSRGGAGLPRPIMNKPIDVSKLTGIVWREDLRWTDIGWPGVHLGVEYDSNEFHGSSEKLGQDARRRTLLQAAGYEVIVVTNEQFRQISELDRIVRAVYRCMGRRQRCRVQNFRSKQAALHKELLRLGS